MSNFTKIRYKNGFDFYKDSDMVPIEELASILGYEKNGDGKICCPCPEHDDKNPSATLGSAKYPNTFKCWSCGEHGGPLELVMAVRSGITPSRYFSALKGVDMEAKIKMRKAREDAALFIEEYFPGNIEIVKAFEEESEKKDEMPELPDWVWEEMGIKKFFGNSHLVVNRWGDGEKVVVEKMKTNPLSRYEQCCLIMDKLVEVQTNLKEFQLKVFKKFPDLSGIDKMYMMKVTDVRIEEISGYYDKFMAYLRSLGEETYDEKVEEDFGKEEKE